MVKFCGELTEPTVSLPKESDVGASVTCVAAVTPVPWTVKVCGLFTALSVIVTVPVSRPVAEGVSVML